MLLELHPWAKYPHSSLWKMPALGGRAFFEPLVAATTKPTISIRSFSSHNRPIDLLPAHALESVYRIRPGPRWISRHHQNSASQFRCGKNGNCPPRFRCNQRGFVTGRSSGISRQTQALQTPAEGVLQAGEDAYVPFENPNAAALPTKEEELHTTAVDLNKEAQRSPVGLGPSHTSVEQSSWPS